MTIFNLNLTDKVMIKNSHVTPYNLLNKLIHMKRTLQLLITTVLIALLQINAIGQIYGDSSEFVKGPYLMFGTNAGDMRVMWQTRNATTSIIKRSEGSCNFDTEETINEINDEHIFIHDFKDLPIGGRTHYEVDAGIDFRKGGFYTRPSDTLSKLSFYAYGDTRTNPQDHDAVSAQILKQMTSARLHTFILSTGDMVSNGNKEESWNNEFFDQNYENISKMLAALPYMTSMGNHEGQGDLFGKYFPYEFFQNERYYYSFKYGIAHFIALDQFAKLKPGSEQYKWLENELKTSTSKWKIIMLHKPGYTAGGHKGNSVVVKYLQPLFKKYGVKLVLAGHNHYYARSEVSGISHITTGGGGAPLYSPKMKSYVKIIDKSNHFLIIDIDGDVLKLKAIRADGTIIEKHNIKL